MNESSVDTLYRRYEWISHRLETEAYKLQMKGRNKPLKQFIPCKKALVFTSAMASSAGIVAGVVIPAASSAICACHPGLSEADLWNLYYQAVQAIPYIEDEKEHKS